MVVIGPDGAPVEVPPWQPRTAVECRRHEAAGRRRELRREIERATTEIRAATTH
jgi:acyl-CoA hydrolase